MAIYRETAHALFGDGGTASDTPKPATKTVSEPVQTRAPEARSFSRDTTFETPAVRTVRTAPVASPADADTSFMSTPAFGARTDTKPQTRSSLRPMLIAGLAGVIALGVGAIVLMNSQPEGVPTAVVATPLTATPAPLPAPMPLEPAAVTPAPIPTAVEATPVRRASAPARRAAAPVARRAAAAPAEPVTVPTGPVPYAPTEPAPAAVAPVIPAPPVIITPAPTPVEPTPVPQ